MHLLGSIGYFYIKVQLWLFGYLGYVWLFVIAYLLYRAQRLSYYTPNKILALVIAFLSLLALQGLFVQNAGIFGIAFNSVLEPIIGSIGIFAFILFILACSLILYSDKPAKEAILSFIKAIKEDIYDLPNKQKALKEKKEKLLMYFKNLFSSPKKIQEAEEPQESNQEIPQESNKYNPTQEDLTTKEQEESLIYNNHETKEFLYKKPKEVSIRLITPKEAKIQDSHNLQQFQRESLLNLEKLKHFEKKYSQQEPQKQEDKIILIQKTQNNNPINQPIEEIDTTQPPTQPQKPKEPIKSYPKKLYSSTPFSSYYEEEREDSTPPRQSNTINNLSESQNISQQNTINQTPPQEMAVQTPFPFYGYPDFGQKPYPTAKNHILETLHKEQPNPKNPNPPATKQPLTKPTPSQEIHGFMLPSLDFLQMPQNNPIEINESEIDKKIDDLLNKLRVFKIEGDIVRTYSGPFVTTLEFRPNANVKVSKILTFQHDIALALQTTSMRIQAPIPGKDVIGIEIPNRQIQTVYLREILESEAFQNSTSPLTLALGKDIVGNPFITDLKKLPHLLIAGTTGSGKSVGMNAMILSLLYRNSPDTLKFIMIDPKKLEFSIYDDIPHLITPVITESKKAIMALSSAVKEMEKRYTLMSKVKTKNIESYNKKAETEGFKPFPYIVIIIDELAELMMTGGKETEFHITRLAQMARASGIHLIVATQRPSVNVVTGIIKANLPSRISYRVGQKIDSKVILDVLGAESLLGNGDMLFTPPGGGLVRLHAPLSTEEEIERIVEFIKSQRPAQYDETFISSEDETQELDYSDETDELYEEAKRIVLTDRKTSASYLQRRLGVGYNRAANIVEQMEARGFLSKTKNPKGEREILGE